MSISPYRYLTTYPTYGPATLYLLGDKPVLPYSVDTLDYYGSEYFPPQALIFDEGPLSYPPYGAYFRGHANVGYVFGDVASEVNGWALLFNDGLQNQLLFAGALREPITFREFGDSATFTIDGLYEIQQVGG